MTVSPALKAQQVVTGRITDGTDGTPIPGAEIFIANTTIGTTSNESGNYSITVPLKGSFEFVVSHVGYQPVFHKIDVPKSLHQIDVAMEVNDIQEVIITARNNYTRGDVNLFWEILLGVRPSNSGLEVLNPEKVYFFRNRDGVLKVSSKEPIEIVNHEMGYRILYVLKSFEYDYKNDEFNITGMPYFEELTPQNSLQQNNWEKKRQDVYAVSLTHFIRALYQDQIHEEGFLLLDSKRSVILNTEDILQADEERVQVNIESLLYLVCFSTPVTARMIEHIQLIGFMLTSNVPVVKLQPQQITVFSDGSYAGTLKMEEYIDSITRLSAMLPVEYLPNISHFD